VKNSRRQWFSWARCHPKRIYQCHQLLGFVMQSPLPPVLHINE
jgi:hypothetical protein